MNEYVIWLKISQKSKPPLILGGTYVPPAGSKIYLHTNFDDVFSDLIQDIAKFLEITPYVALSGDLNSRTGKIIDFEQVIEGKDSELISILNDNSSHIFRP